jgi:hypothetical protein
MRRSSCIFLATFAVTFATNPSVQAGWYQSSKAACKQFYANCKRDFHRNNCWPTPFVQPERVRVQRPLELMTLNGWQQQNLLGAHYFDPETGDLTTAGELKVRSVLTQSPPAFRTVFVEQGDSREVTEARLAAVREWANGRLPETVVVDVRESNMVARGRPAEVVDMINVKFQQSQPVPQLPQASGGGDDGGSSGGF